MQSVAILLATYNGEKYIEEFLISLQGQTFQNYICYIHDDGSKDRTRRIAEEFEKRDSGGTQPGRGEGELFVDAWADRGGILYVCGSG